MLGFGKSKTGLDSRDELLILVAVLMIPLCTLSTLTTI
jgi:hypothetical protein